MLAWTYIPQCGWSYPWQTAMGPWKPMQVWQEITPTARRSHLCDCLSKQMCRNRTHRQFCAHFICAAHIWARIPYFYHFMLTHRVTSEVDSLSTCRNISSRCQCTLKLRDVQVFRTHYLRRMTPHHSDTQWSPYISHDQLFRYHVHCLPASMKRRELSPAGPAWAWLRPIAVRQG